jgi:hypothetical protein
MARPPLLIPMENLEVAEPSMDYARQRRRTPQDLRHHCNTGKKGACHG